MALRLLHVTPYLDSAYGGPAVAIREMAKIAFSQGISVEIATTNAAGNMNSTLPNGFVHIDDGVICRYFNRLSPVGWFRSSSLTSWLKSHISDYDLLHIHVPFTAPFSMAAKLARKSGVPYVVSPHGLLDPWCLCQKAWKKIPYLQFFEKNNLAHAATFHVTSPLEQKFVSALKLGPTTNLISLPVNTCGDQIIDIEKVGPTWRILCVARIHPVKGLPILFESLALLKDYGMDVVLDLAGDGDIAYIEFLKGLTEKLGIASNIIWHGFVNEKEKGRLYAKAHLFILLSYHENFGLAVAESMAAGVPAIVSDQTGLAQDILDYRCGSVVETGDPKSAADAIMVLLKSGELSLYAQRAIKLVTERYGAAECAQSLVRMYKDALHK